MWARAFDALASEVEMGFWGGDDDDKHIRNIHHPLPT